MKGDEIVWPCDQHNNKTGTLRKNVTKYKNIWKSMVKFLRKFKNHGIIIAQVNSILITKYTNLQLFTSILYGVGVHCDVDISQGDHSIIISRFLYYQLLLILIEDIVRSISKIKKRNLRWKLNVWHLFERLCFTMIFEWPEMAKHEILDFSGPTCLS